MPKPGSGLFAAALSLFAGHARGEPGASSGKATFSARATAGLKLEGESAALTAAWSEGSLVVTLPLASFQTGIELRDRHLRDHIESDKYPNAELRVPLAALQLPAAGASTSGTAQAGRGPKR